MITKWCMHVHVRMRDEFFLSPLKLHVLSRVPMFRNLGAFPQVILQVYIQIQSESGSNDWHESASGMWQAVLKDWSDSPQ